jgi:hypothetical protein
MAKLHFTLGENLGYMKVHHDECYGYYSPYNKYKAPTNEQISAVCAYADKFYNGKIYTKCKLTAYGKNDPVSTYKLRQMDEIALRNVFE